eukprot:CAMPEP_0182569830 /NCGR_PEP_ID=MMETSP1324-20130603/10339_1 /TAXON_ID=236786 /ORGANISM="Florenciella sp., Strain RCC1587" /LENGTH=74 /DNA_ID=CAMNT_0024784153 /DNA_START=1 /DNA_END=225 /DNA_ORIENTATION=-
MYADPHYTAREIPSPPCVAHAQLTFGPVLPKKWGLGDHIAIYEVAWAYLNEHRSASEELQAIHDAGRFSTVSRH